LPAEFTGLILANEVLDAMPAHLLAWHGTDLFERGVTSDGDEFQWSDRPLMKGELLAAACELNFQIDPGSDYISEINLDARRFMLSLGDVLRRGVILLIDYGFGREEYYHAERNRGTLMCHYRHRVHDNPFYLPGLQDITSHVDFSAVADASKNAGLELLGYTNQAYFLINCGITGILAQTPAENAKDYLPLANQVQKLVSPAEMGELFKVIAFGKNIRQPPSGFISGDKSRML
jgi:SAM-dependent MidA family methyltransferase